MKIKKFNEKKEKQEEQDILFNAKSLEKNKEDKTSFKTSTEDQEKTEKEFKKQLNKIEKFESFITISIVNDEDEIENDYDVESHEEESEEVGCGCCDECSGKSDCECCSDCSCGQMEEQPMEQPNVMNLSDFMNSFGGHEEESEEEVHEVGCGCCDECTGQSGCECCSDCSYGQMEEQPMEQQPMEQPKVMKYLKLYESFILESQSETSIIKLYPEEQIFDKSKKSILLIPGGEVGKPEVDYSKIAPGLVDTFNVYSCNWPEEINVKKFAMNLSKELTNIGKFTIGGFSFGCPIAFHLANILENNGNKNFLKTVFFIDGGAPVNSPEEQKTNIVLMNPPRARCAKRFDFYCQDLRDNGVTLSPDLKLPLEPKAVESEALKNFGTQWNSTVKVDADFTKTNTTFDEKEYNNWKSGKQVLEFLGETTIPTIEDIKQLITDKKFKEESVWIVEDKFPTQEILTHYGLNITDWLGQPKAGESFVELDIRGKMQFAEKQITTKTDWYREKITLKSKCILFIAEIDKVFNKSVKDGKIIQNGVEENRKPTSESEELILCKGVDHNNICNTSFAQIIDKIKSIIK